jgi:hypothetical protein
MAEAPTSVSSEDPAVFPALSTSEYRVEAATVGERYWFSGGATLNQQQTADAVGFVWTHWLADRGIQVAGTNFDEAYAHELQRECQRLSGIPESPESGGFAWAAARVLQDRGLVETCFTCPDLPAIQNALLERGPIILGLVWHQSMFEPQLIDGRYVCRVDQDPSARGGHAVLLNGISLDLRLGGVTGFVRFKNSWGPDWGENGQCLISLDDLETLLKQEGEALLPIPVATALGPGGQPGAAEVEEDLSGPELVRYQQEAISSDLWTTRDTVGYAAYAEAIARGIQHADTRPPLTIGIKAPWGAGKTSLMRMVRDRLEWPLGDQAARNRDKLREIRLTPASRQRLSAAPQLREVTNGTVLSQVKSADREREEPSLAATPRRPVAEDSAAQEDRKRWRPTVWFNPWSYQTGEQVWAGLAHEIITQTTSRMSPIEREHFWLRLNLRRVDEQSVRRKIYQLVLSRVVPFALVAGFLVVIGLLVVVLGGPRLIGLGLAGGSPIALAAVVAGQIVAVLRTRVSGTLSRLVAPSTATRGPIGAELGAAYADLVRSPDYRQAAGFLYLVQSDLREVLDLVASDQHPLVVFVDDLDRCSPGTVVQVIEAINVFLAGDFANVIFVIAMEPQMVAAHVEAAYADLVEKLRESTTGTADAVGLGWKFLEKFIQLPLTLPIMETEQTKVFFQSLFPRTADRAPVEPTAAAPTALPPPTGSLRDVLQMPGTVGAPPTPENKEAIRRLVERQLSADNPEVQAVIAYGARMLNPNPREIKRFVNVFRFFAMIHTERRLLHLGTPVSLEALAKLAVLATRWPSLISVLAQPATPAGRQSVLQLLEEATPDLAQQLAGTGLGEHVVQQLLATDLRGFLAAEPKVGGHAAAYL